MTPKLHPATLPHDVGVILSYRCPGSCKHCVYNCGPDWETKPMSVTNLERCLETIARWPEPPHVHLTGGEPFLFYDLLLDGTRIAAELGLTTYLETSAVWCVDDAIANERFRELQEAGLSAVLISCTPFHSERIPPNRTLRAVRTALGIFGPRGVIVFTPEFLQMLHNVDPEELIPIEHYEETFGLEQAGRLLWDGYQLIAGGRSGYKLGYLLTGKRAQEFAGESCGGNILYASHSHMDLYGNYIPSFCGGLRIADWRFQDPLKRPYTPLIELLIEQGPYGLYNLAQKRYDYRPLPGGYAGKCHLCVDVRWHLLQSKGDDYPEIGPIGFYRNI